MSESFERYARARDDIVASLDELRTILDQSVLDPGDLREVERELTRLRDGRFVLAVVGEFSSGKSFLLNALLGKFTREERVGSPRIIGLLATDINPSTATITELAYGSEEQATAHYPNGREERIPLDRLSRFVAVGEEAKLHDATGDESGAPTLVRVAVRSQFLENGFVVADTPGLASINPAHRRATLTYLPSADAVLYLIDTQQPFTDGDASFLGIIRRYIETIFIVQTKIDLWRAQDGGREAWRAAAGRIVAQAAIHAPNTPVFPLSAYEYAQGVLDANPELITTSRFEHLFRALDASLVATTGRARLERAAAAASALAQRATEAIGLDIAALSLSSEALVAQRTGLIPQLDALATTADRLNTTLVALGSELRAAIAARGDTMRANVLQELARAFDITDIARLRDRAKLHIVIDTVLSTAVGTFAAEVSDEVAQRFSEAGSQALDELTHIDRSPLPLTSTLAQAFDADDDGGAWSVDLATGLRGTIVLSALGGPSVSLVESISARFGARQSGGYMKRELLADMNAEIGDAFDRDVATFIDDIGARIERAASSVGLLLLDRTTRARCERLGAIDRSLAVAQRGEAPSVVANDLRARADRVAALASHIGERSTRFATESAVDPSTLADPSLADTPTANAIDADDVRFDPKTYEQGLRPERWRVAVVGAFKRGKSSLINALAGTTVLTDEDGSVEFRFPVHVRYGPQARICALTETAQWEPLAAEAGLAAAARTPLLIETPWNLPHDLVLVHVPAFDSGLPDAESIVLEASSRANEILALFSRQLSDRELDLYGRLAPLGKPMTFVHTLADHESSNDRRNVVRLAERYLRERAIIPQRLFTTSTRDKSAWNEIGALRETLIAHANEHADRVRRVAREREEQARLAAIPSNTSVAKASFFARLFGRSRP